MASPKSLESLYAQQTVQVISPVTINGQSVIGSAAAVCASLGFTRLVAQQTERCTVGEPLLILRSAEVESVQIVEPVNGGLCISGWPRLHSVTCAK